MTEEKGLDSLEPSGQSVLQNATGLVGYGCFKWMILDVYLSNMCVDM